MAGQMFSKARRAFLLAAALLVVFPYQVAAQAVSKGDTGLPLPRFASIKASRVNMRVGPGTDYASSWVYTRPGLPVEIIAEFENWRRIRDADGTEGWVYHSMLSGQRTAIAAPWMVGKDDKVFLNMRTLGARDATVTAKVQPGVVVRLDQCNGDWCRANADGAEGWISQAEIWGAYPGEAFK